MVNSYPLDLTVGEMKKLISLGKIIIRPNDITWSDYEVMKYCDSITNDFPLSEIFLYETTDNIFDVIDGNNRLIALTTKNVKDSRLVRCVVVRHTSYEDACEIFCRLNNNMYPAKVLSIIKRKNGDSIETSYCSDTANLCNDLLDLRELLEFVEDRIGKQLIITINH